MELLIATYNVHVYKTRKVHSWQQSDKQIVVFYGKKTWDHYYDHAHFSDIVFSLINFVHFSLNFILKTYGIHFHFYFGYPNIITFCISWQYVWVHFMICMLKLVSNLMVKIVKKFFFNCFFSINCKILYFFLIFYLFLQITLYVKDLQII